MKQNSIVNALLLSIVLAGQALAAIRGTGEYISFSGDDGGDEVRFYPKDSECFKAEHPVEKDGVIWEWICRNSEGRRLYAGSQKAFVFMENIYDIPSNPLGLQGWKMRWEQSMGMSKAGIRLRYFDGRGRVLWDKTEMKGAPIKDGIMSYDGGIFAILMEGGKPDAKYLVPGPDVDRHWIRVYNVRGESLFDFPERAVCHFSFITNFWISSSGQYMMVPCFSGLRSVEPYFFMPRAGTYWHADRLYEMERNANTTLTGEDEEFGRLAVNICRYEGNDHSCRTGDLTLGGVEWRPLQELRQGVK